MLLDRLSSSQWLGWKAYAAVEPFGERRGDLRIGILSALIANIHRGKNDPIRKPEDFMAYEPKPALAASPRTLSEQIKAAFSKFRRG